MHDSLDPILTLTLKNIHPDDEPCTKMVDDRRSLSRRHDSRLANLKIFLYTLAMWFQTVDEVIAALRTDPLRGLSQDEVSTRLKKFGFNEIPEDRQESWLKRILEQFTVFLVLMLIAAAVISFFLNEKTDSLAIIAIVILNGIMGFIQELKADKSLKALKKMAPSLAKVIRAGQPEKIEARLLVPGDIILLESGDKIPADARLTESFNFKVSEAILTGESEAIEKNANPVLGQEIGLAERVNMVFGGTTVTYGRAKALVVYTGTKTEIGRISQVIAETRDEPSPLKKEMEKSGRAISFAALLIVLLVFILGVFFDHLEPFQMFLTSVSLAVAAIPEGLPAVITIVLAIGVSRLAKHNAIIKKLPAVEALGATTHILTDKTGTLTQNKITVHQIVTPEAAYQVAGEGYSPIGQILKKNHLLKKEEPYQVPRDELLRLGLKAAVLCSDAIIQEKGGRFEPFGDITEAALVVAAQRAGLNPNQVRKNNLRLFEIPFSSDNMFMLTVCQDRQNENRLKAYLKGAPEIVAEKCNSYQKEGQAWPRDGRFTVFVESETQNLNNQALRSLAVAERSLTAGEFQRVKNGHQIRELVNGFTFLAIFGLRDAIRPEAVGAIRESRKSGITTIMITGDHRDTAVAIAQELGLIENKNQAIDGTALNRLSETDLLSKIKEVRVFARVDPSQKLRLVRAFKSFKDNVVAVTGDGVNDAPSIKAADVGIAMGIEGTDVSREVADIVLKDDNFATIVEAVKQGRAIFANLIKFIRYLISCNISEILVILFGVLAKRPLPLEPIQLLWVNLVTDGLPALALGMENEEFDAMKQPPRRKSEGLLTKKRWLAMSVEGSIMDVSIFILFDYLLTRYNLAVARTAAFSALSITQLFHAFNNRSERNSIFKLGIFSNLYLTATLALSLFLQYLVIYTPFGEKLFDAVPLAPNIILLVALVSVIPVVYSEAAKALRTNHTDGPITKVSSPLTGFPEYLSKDCKTEPRKNSS